MPYQKVCLIWKGRQSSVTSLQTSSVCWRKKEYQTSHVETKYYNDLRGLKASCFNSWDRERVTCIIQSPSCTAVPLALIAPLVLLCLSTSNTASFCLLNPMPCLFSRVAVQDGFSSFTSSGSYNLHPLPLHGEVAASRLPFKMFHLDTKKGAGARTRPPN